MRPNGMPSDTPDYMADAWLSALEFTIGHPDALKQFQADTGIRPLAQGGLAAMIDQATGYDEYMVKAFVEWFNECVWGPIDGTVSSEP